MKTPDQEHPTEMPEACATTPMGRAIRLIGDAWILLIIINLLRGPMRFNALRDSMGHISSKTLSQRLKVLEEIGFVQRQAFLEIPPRVEYSLTEKGQELGDVIAAIEQFAHKNLSDLVAPVLDASSCIADDFTSADLAGKPALQRVE
jgi:DNA-binding HxlR family transcriptional regulator